MEKAKTIDLSKRPIEERNEGNIPGCPVWIFGDDESADRDLKEKFAIKDEEDSDK